jgi:hypothetical protein
MSTSTNATSDLATAESKPTRLAGDSFVGGGLLVLVAIFVALMVLAGEVTPFWVMPAVVYLVLGAFVMRRAPRWLLIVAIVLPLLQVGTGLPFVIPGLTHPETPASFLPDALVIIVSIVVVIGAALALRGSSSRARRRVATFATLLAAAAALISVFAASGITSDARQSGDVAVAAANTDYPERVEAPQGGALWVDNQDPFRHTFVVEGTDVRAELPGATAVRLDIDLAPGTYTFICDVTGHEEAMKGTLSVKE